MGYIFLSFAILAEVVATLSLKASEGFTKLGPSIVVIIGYMLAGWLLSLCLKTLPVSVAYATWAGAGIVLVALLSVLFFEQKVDLAGIIGMSFIITGAVILNLYSKINIH